MPDLHDLLVKTSRTFGASIPLLNEPLRRQVTLAYLLFRIADTFEDAVTWPPQRKIGALHTFAEHLQGSEADNGDLKTLAQRWAEDPPVDHAGYTELLSETPYVLEELGALDDAPRRRIIHHTIRTAHGMADIVRRTDTDGALQLRDLDDLRHYCYIVAGIVGEMLTDLFLIECPEAGPHHLELEQQAKDFGEGLQLVNILKDSASDAVEGRSFLHPSLDRNEVFALARGDLETAGRYLMTFARAGADTGVCHFLALPLFLAWATLDRVESEGPGAKLTRPEVASYLMSIQHAFTDTTRPDAYEALLQTYTLANTAALALKTQA